MIRVRIPFAVEVGTETHEGEIRLVDACNVERRFQVNLPLEGVIWAYDWLLFGAFCVLKRDGRAGKDYDKWLESVEGFRIGGEPDEDEAENSEDGAEGEDPKGHSEA